ncbi:uncharacterized protein [Typha latifolia]|uniref:uncharacterized protein n=1 Tax=Typha latifolia TaxID=4733 RepID=UPI003C2FDF91
MAPLEMAAAERGGEERWRQLDSSVNAVSFGFVATAILISLFLIMAIFERFLRGPAARSSQLLPRRVTGSNDLEAQRRRHFAGKLDCPSPKMSIYSKGVSVLMPGHNIPTFIAHPAPAPCPPERISWPSHQQNSFSGSSSDVS